MTDTSDHVWSQEQIAAYIAGGLDAQEAERLEAHARECPACAAALTAARRLDGGLSALFADARPALELEDRAVHKLRTTSHRPLLGGWVKRAVAALAAMIILGTVGAFANSLVKDGGLPMPGFAAREQSKLPAQSVIAIDGSESMQPREGLTNEDFGLQSNLDGSLPAIDRVDKQTVNQSVTNDNLGQPNAPEPFKVAMGDGLAKSLGTSTYNMWYDGGTIGVIVDKKVSEGDIEKRKDLGKKITGRSGATASTTLSSGGGIGGGNGTGLNGTNFLSGYYGNPLYTGVAAGSGDTGPGGFGTAVFKPSDHKPTIVAPVAEPQPDPKKNPDPKVPPIVSPEPKPAAPPEVNPEPTKRVILRSGDIEFEIESFDAASATVIKLVNGIKGALPPSIKSETLANGKVKGSITVRVPPEFLDSLVLDLRKELGKGGTLRSVRIGSQDVSKQYYDLESHLRNARTMETRLLQMIKEGKGEIKQLLDAEKELGVWRTKIEEFEGEIRYYANLAALSTLTISLTEKEIRTENERVQAGVEVEDVDKAYQAVLAAVADAKGRMTKSELKQLSAGQFNATLNFEVAPEVGGPIRDRLAQLGHIARLEIDRVTQTEGGTLPTDAKAKRGDTVFLVQLYNLANIAPRETATLEVAVVDVPASYRAIRDAIAKTKARVIVAQLDEHDRQNVTAQIDFEVRRGDEAALRTALDSAGEVVGRQVNRAAEGENVTDAKVLYKTTLMAANRLKPRETTLLSVEVADVTQTTAAFASQVAEVKGWQVDAAQSTRERNGRMSAKVVYLVPLTAEAGLVERFKAAGIVRSQQSNRDPHASDGKFATARIEVSLTNTEDIVAPDAGIWPQVKRGLSYSASVLLTSVTWVVFGLCVVLPWALIGFAGFRVGRRLIYSEKPETPPSAPPAPPAAASV